MADECSGRCRSGMIQVTDVWARQRAGIDRHQDMADLERLANIERDVLTDARLRVQRREIDPLTDQFVTIPETPHLTMWANYVAALNTVFPCPTCRPDQFARWRHGCYRPGHVASRCRHCREAKAA